MRLDPVSIINHSRTITREWIQYLTPAEFMVLMFIFDRTYGWSKNAECIPMSHFLKGVHRGAKTYHHSLPVSERTIQRAISSLTKKGAIVSVRQHRKPKNYEINFDWKTPMGLKLPRRLRDQTEVTRQFDTPQKRINMSNDSLRSRPKKSGEDEDELESDAALEDAETSRGAVNLALFKSQKARNAKLVKAVKKPGSANTTFTIWQSYCRIYFKGMTVLPWTVAEKGIANTLRRKCIEGGMSPKDFGEFIKWVIENWSLIMRSRFEWMDKPSAPEFPKLKFFVRWLTEFVELQQAGIKPESKERKREPKESERVLGKKRKELLALEQEIAKKREMLRGMTGVHRGSQKQVESRLSRFRTAPIERERETDETENPKPKWPKTKQPTTTVIRSFQWQDKD